MENKDKIQILVWIKEKKNYKNFSCKLWKKKKKKKKKRENFMDMSKICTGEEWRTDNDFGNNHC